MRKADLDRFVQSYAGERTAVIGGPFTRALGVNIESTLALYTSILEDFDEINYGINWWQTYASNLDWKRRVLICKWQVFCHKWPPVKTKRR